MVVRMMANRRRRRSQSDAIGSCSMWSGNVLILMFGICRHEVESRHQCLMVSNDVIDTSARSRSTMEILWAQKIGT